MRRPGAARPASAAASCMSTPARRARPFASPDPHPLARREVQLLARLDGERVVPGVLVAHRIRPVFGRGVPVRDDALAQGGLADLLPPALRVADEELLIAGEARDGGRFLAA